jgi:hypothetical protein
MNDKTHRPTAEELADLDAYLAARAQGQAPKPGQPGFPGGLAGELIQLSESSEPDPAFSKALERKLQETAVETEATRRGWLSALWQSFNQNTLSPERKTTMQRLLPVAIVCILVIAILWAVIPSLFPTPTQTQVALVTPPTRTPAPSLLSPLTPTVASPTSKSPVAINFTPQIIPSQPPKLPSLVDALGSGYGGSGTGNLLEGLPVTLGVELPAGPDVVTAYYRLENTPMTLDEAHLIASRWGLTARYFMPAWMQSIEPNQVERSYIAIDGMQELSMWNGELSYTDLSIFPIFGGHQYPQSDLPTEEQSVATAVNFLTSRGYLNYPYMVDLSHYNYGLVDFYRQLDGISVSTHAASVKLDQQARVGNALINREEYQSVGTYPIISAQDAWDILASGAAKNQLSISYIPTQDGNPRYWGRIYPTGQAAQVYGSPTYLLPADASGTPYVEFNNLVLEGDLSGLLEKLESGIGYIHAWGEVKDVNGTRMLQLAGWESFNEFSGYFNGIIRRTEQGDFLELSDGTHLSLPGLPADVPADLPVYAQGGQVGNALEWFILQAHPFDEGQVPPDLSQAQAVIDKVELVYLAPGLNAMPTDIALDSSYRMLVPAWSFTGQITNTSGELLLYRAYVQAVPNQ